MTSQCENRVLIVGTHTPTTETLAGALSDAGSTIVCDVVEDARECLDVLQGSETTPDIVVFDLEQSPGSVFDPDRSADDAFDPDRSADDVFELFERRDDDATLRRVPIVVLSGTNDPETIDRWYERGVTGVVRRPDTEDGFVALAETFAEYWFSNARLPRDRDVSVGESWR